MYDVKHADLLMKLARTVAPVYLQTEFDMVNSIIY